MINETKKSVLSILIDIILLLNVPDTENKIDNSSEIESESIFYEFRRSESEIFDGFNCVRQTLSEFFLGLSLLSQSTDHSRS